MRRQPSSVAVLGIVLLIVSVSPAFLQAGTTQAQLNGTVRDPNGSVIVKAAVGLRNLDTNQRFVAQTDVSGFYILTTVAPGRYEVTVEYVGFARYIHTGIMLRVGQTANFDVALKLANAQEKVELNSEAPLTEPQRNEISEVVETGQIQSLPTNDRQATNFALLSPGVANARSGLQSTFTDPATTRISFGGQRDLNNMVTVDGADDINTATGLQRATPSQEAIEEFRVVNSDFGAEYGHTLGGVISVATKSGTNSYHGSGYEYLQNNAVDANSPLALPGFTALRQNQFGMTLGGPVRKDKLFFFTNYEGQRRAQSPSYPSLLINNLAAINTVKQTFALAPENLNLLQTADLDNGFVRMDAQLNARNRLAARYSVQDARDLNMLVGDTLDGGGIGAPSSGRNGFLRDQSLAGTLTSNISSSVTNQALVQWARRNYGFPGVSGQPDLEVPNVLLFGHNFAAFDRYNESRGESSDNLLVVRGKHYWSLGFDADAIRNFAISPGFTPARVIFPSFSDLLASGKSNWGSAPCPPPLVGLVAPCITDFYWGAPVGPGAFNPNQPSPPVPTTWQNAYLPSEASDFDVRLNHGEYGFFAQDQYRVTPKLTLNYGLRWDFESGLGAYVNPDHRSLQPRIGVAYSLDQKTVIRSGYGIYYDTYSVGSFLFAGSQRPPILPDLPTANNQQTGTWLLNTLALPTPCVLPGCPLPGGNLPPGTEPPPLITSAFENLINSGSFPNNEPFAQGGALVSRNLREPYSEQASLEMDRELGHGLLVGVGYLWVAAHKLARPINLNVGPPVGQETGTNKDIYNFALLEPSIPAPPAGSPGTAGFLYYTDSTGNSSYNGLTLRATKKSGRYLQFNLNYTFSKTMDDGTSTTFINVPQSNVQRNLERAISNQDVRHRFVADFTAQAPDHSPARNFVFSSIITAQSPRPFTLFVGFDANNDGNPFTDRVGASRRNTYLGDDLRTWDLRLSRTIFLPKERYSLQLAFDAFNVLNRANIDEVSTVYGAPDFIGPEPQHYKDGIMAPAGLSFGAPRTAFGPRQLQFSAKFTF